MNFGPKEKQRAKELLATTIQIGTTVIANAMRIMPGSILLVVAMTLHFLPEIHSILDDSKLRSYAIEEILWQGVVMSFSLAVFDAGARTFLKANRKDIRL